MTEIAVVTARGDNSHSDPAPGLFVFGESHYSMAWMPLTEVPPDFGEIWKPTEEEKAAASGCRSSLCAWSRPDNEPRFRMCPRVTTSDSLRFRPLTPETWGDFERLFGESGACGGCWCMWWRQTRREFDEKHGEKNRRAMKRVVDSGETPGVLAYDGGEPVGWCSVAPRESFASLNRSRVLKRLDDEPVWSIVCLFLAKSHRRRGLTAAVVRGAVAHVRKSGGKVVEAYPTRPRGKKLEAVSSFIGVPASFERAGFVECARPSEAKVVMRYRIK